MSSRTLTADMGTTTRAIERVLVLALAVAAVGCGPSAPDRVDAAALAPTGSTCPPGSTLTYESFGRAFFEEYCQRCHASSVTGVARRGAPATVTFDDVAEIRRQSVAIDLRAAAGPNAVNTDMPREFPVPSLAEREQLGEWLACGAP